eukprot:TRINITY_DN227_c1_g2_i1.p1 TRINITY_DN227_c1_g2~~TRINITY_DN227_c1_g2_i1.p1  ORF type:complete len:2180 (-),score=747.59 TRINITY_DN227_c1_g2_i1:16-6117(-)
MVQGGSQYAWDNPGQAAFTSQVFPRSSKVHVTDLGSAMRAASLLSSDLGSAPVRWGAPPGTYTEQDWHKHYLQHKANVSKGVNDLLGEVRLNPNNLKREVIDAKCKELALEMRGLASCARNLAALSDDNIPLLDGSKAVADSVTDLMKLITGALDEPNAVGFEAALEAIGKEVHNAELLLEYAKLSTHVDKSTELLLIECISNVDIAMNDVLVSVGKASTGMTPGAQAEMAKALKSLKAVSAPTTQALKNLAPYSLDPNVRQQLMVSHGSVDNMNKELIRKALGFGMSAENQNNVNSAANNLAKALQNLLLAADVADKVTIPADINLHTPALSILDTLDSLRTELNNDNIEPMKFVPMIKAIASSNNEIVSAASKISGHLDEPTNQKISAAASQISDKLRFLMEATRDFNKNPQSLEAKNKITVAGNALELATEQYLETAGSITALNTLRNQSKATATSAVKLTRTIQVSANSITDSNLRQLLLDSAAKMSEAMPSLLRALQGASLNPNSYVTQSQLLESLKSQMTSMSELAAQSKKAARVVRDRAKQQDLDYAANETSKDLRLLMKAITDVSDIKGETDIENAIAEFDAVKADLETLAFYAQNKVLRETPDQSRENAISMLNGAMELLNVSVVDLVNAAKKGDDSIAALIKQAAVAGGQIAVAARPVAASLLDDPQTQLTLIGSAQNVVNHTKGLAADCRSLSLDPKNPNKIRAVEDKRKAFVASLDSLADVVRSLDAKDMNRSIDELRKNMAKLSASAPPGTDYLTASDALQGATKALANTVTQLANEAANRPHHVAPLGKLAASTTNQVLQLASIAAGATSNDALMKSLLAAARDLANAMVGMIPSVQTVMTSKNPKEAYGKLVNQIEPVQEALDKILSQLGGSSDAEKAISKIHNIMNAIDSDQYGVIPGSRQDILNEFLGGGKDLSRVQASLVASSKAGDEKYGVFAREAASALTKLAFAAKSANISDNSGDHLTIDGARICKGLDFIQKNPHDTKRVHHVAKQITRACGNLIAAAKANAHDQNDPAKRKEIVARAQKLVAASTDLAQAARAATTRKDNESYASLLQVSKAMKDETLALEAAMRSGKDSKDHNIIDKATAKQIVSGTKNLGAKTADLISASAALKSNPQSKKAQTEVSERFDAATKALQDVLLVCGTLNPVVQGCERAIDEIEKASIDLETSAMTVVGGEKLTVPPSDKSLVDVHSDTLNLTKQVAYDIKELLAATSKSPAELISAMNKLGSTFPQLASNIQHLGANIDDSAQVAQQLTMAKLLGDNLKDLLIAVKGASMNDPEARINMTKYSDSSAKALGMLLQQLQSGAQLSQGLERSADEIASSLESLQTAAAPSKNYPVVRDQLVAATRELSTQLTELVSADKSNAGEVGLIASRIAEIMPKLVDASRQCAATTKDASAKSEIVETTQVVGENVELLVLTAKQVLERYDENSIKSLLDTYNETNVSISELIGAVKKGAVGEAAMEKSVASIREAVLKLGVSDIFARAGQLSVDSKNAKTPVTELQSELANVSKDLTKLTGKVKRKAMKHSEKDIGPTTEKIATDIEQLIDLAISTASRIPDSVAQIDILASSKDLAEDVANLIDLARQTQSGQRNIDDESTQKELSLAHRQVGNKIGALVAVVQTSSAEASHGERELERTRQQILSLTEDIPGEPGATLDDVIRAARETLSTCGEFVFATETDDVIQYAKGMFIVTEKLLNSAKGVSELTSDQSVSQPVITSAVDVAKAICDLINVGKRDRSDEATGPKLEAASTKVAEAMGHFVEKLRKLPGGQNLSLEEPGADLDRKAEQELLHCAELINSSAQSIKQINPTSSEVSGRDEINKALISASSAIARATGTLVSTAAGAQQERIKFKDEHRGKFKAVSDPMWSQGLINAAQNTSSAVDVLLNATVDIAQGKSDEAAIVNAAKSVAGATQHLVTASRAKSDPNSDAQKKLRVASQAVTDSTAALVNAANSLKKIREEEEAAKAIDFTAAGKVVELEQQMKILKLEKALDRERRKLLAIKRAKQLQ